MLKVASGIYKNRKLLVPKKSDIRPTSEKVRMAAFDILRDIKDMVFLDLFSGSGAMAIEAVSRGARKAYSVENNPEHVMIIRQNIQNLEIESKVQVFPIASGTFLKKKSELLSSVNVIFLDPPYQYHDLPKVMKLVFEMYEKQKFEQLQKIVLETAVNSKIRIEDFPETESMKKYGDTRLFIWDKNKLEKSSLDL